MSIASFRSIGSSGQSRQLFRLIMSLGMSAVGVIVFFTVLLSQLGGAPVAALMTTALFAIFALFPRKILTWCERALFGSLVDKN